MIAENENITIKVDLHDNMEQLINFSKTLSVASQKFTKKFVKTIHQLLQPNSMAIPNYLALIQEHFVYQKVITAQTICARILVPGDHGFKCLQCQNEDNSVICIECFNKSDHKGHQYQKIQINGGCCDCGDDQKWKVQGSCTDHMNKCINVDVDKDKTDIFIQQMKYVLYLLYILGLFPHVVPRHKQNITAYLQAFVKYLKNFNTESMISNQMTYMLFKQKFNFPQLRTIKTYSLRITVLQFLFRFYNEKQYCRILIDMFIIMFTRPQFRKYLTQQYNRLTSAKSLILLSELSNISCQIYTSHRVVSQLIQQNKFAPVGVQPLDIGTKFETVADIYCRYYLDLVYLCNLYNGVGEVYSNFHMKEGNIVNICGYQKYAKYNPQQSVQYYGIQIIMFNRYVEILKYAHKNADITKKSIIDLVNSIKQTPLNQPLSLYITKERTLILLLMILFNGNISKASHREFLAQVGLDESTVHKILQQVLYLLKFYALNLANRQTVQRYYTFYAFSLNKRPRVIVSLDLELLKFCICALQQLQYDHSFSNTVNVNIFYQKELMYQMEYMPVENLVTLPTQFILKELDKNMGISDDQIYDRKKAITVLSDYIGILAQAILSNHSELILRVTFGIGKSQQASSNKILYFYTQILSSFETLKIQEFKEICKIFIEEQKDVMQKFVKEFCIIENRKIRLNPSKISESKAINLGYLKTKKCCQPLIAYFASNSLKNGYEKKPLDVINIDNRKILIDRLFPKLFITRICQIVAKYGQKMLQNPELLKKDIAHFQSFLQQLIFLHYTINSQSLQQSLTSLLQTPKIFSTLSQRVQKQLKTISGQTKQSTIMAYNTSNTKMQQELEKKHKQQQIKNKKIQKLKSKQIKAIDSLKDQQKLMEEEQSQESLINPICMFCKMGENQEPLSLLCFEQKSNLISRFYLNQYYPPANLLTTCNHYAHNSCNRTVNQLKEYIHCNLCKSSCNRLIVIQTDKQLQVKEQKVQNMQQQQQAAIEQLKFKKFSSPQTKQKQKQQQNSAIPYKNEFSAIQTQIETIALSIVYGAVGNFNFFNRSVSKVCCVLLRKLVKEQGSKKIHVNNLISLVNWAMEAKKEKGQEEDMYWRVYKFVILSICSLVGVQRKKDMKENVRNLQQKLPKEIVTNLTQILACVRSPQSLSGLQNLKIPALKQLALHLLPQLLSELAVNIGKCPCCLTISNQIAMCLICGFKSCVGCKATSLREHVKEMHGQSSVFIRVDEGLPIYVSLKKNRYMQHLYLNFLGQSFSFLKIKESQKINYKLNHEAYRKVCDDITRFRIQQQIRYMEYTTGKVSIIQP